MLSLDAGPTLLRSGPLAVIEERRGDYVLSIKDAARILSISTRTIWRMIGARKLNAIQISERRKGLLASEIARHMSGAAK